MKLQKIFELVLQNYTKEKNFRTGICWELNALFDDTNLSIDSYERAFSFLRANKPSPTLHNDFYNNEEFNKDGKHWWHLYGSHEIIPERVRFIEHLINICKEQNL